MSETSLSKKYNTCIDFVKGIACLGVVCIHCGFPNQLGVIVRCVFRFAVPFFFMVSGYFCFYANDIGKVGGVRWHKLKHIITLCVGATALYLMFDLVRWRFGSYTFSVSIHNVIKFLAFNEPSIIMGQMWFLFALLYVYIIYAVIEKLQIFKLAYAMIPVTMALYFFLAYVLYFCGKTVSPYYYRNFAFLGYPMFMLGHCIHKNEDKLHKIKKSWLVWIIAISTIAVLIERYLEGREYGMHMATFVQVIAIFIYAVNSPDMKTNVVQKIGQRYAMLVYVIHPMLWQLWNHVYEFLQWDNNTIALYLKPPLLCLITLTAAVLSDNCIKRIQNLPKNLRQQE